jgi:NADH-quinone oxidoreductase subunit E
MLSPEEIREIEDEARLYPDRKAAAIDALKIVQEHRRWISDESLREIADFLGMTAEDLDGIATFYNLIHRKPVGRHVIHVCNSVSCWIMGCDAVLSELGDRLQVQPGGTTADGRFTLLPIQCLGHCERAPAVMIDHEMHGDLSAGGIGEVLEKYP